MGREGGSKSTELHGGKRQGNVCGELSGLQMPRVQSEALSGQSGAGVTDELQSAEGPACNVTGSRVHPAVALEPVSLGSLWCLKGRMGPISSTSVTCFIGAIPE